MALSVTFKDQGIDGQVFIELPPDRNQLKTDFKLTFGGATKIANLLSEYHDRGSGSDTANGHEEEPSESMHTYMTGESLCACY